jgi:hypothetical protein
MAIPDDASPPSRSAVGETLLRWGMFSVGFALLPVVFNGLAAGADGGVRSSV